MNAALQKLPFGGAGVSIGSTGKYFDLTFALSFWTEFDLTHEPFESRKVALEDSSLPCPQNPRDRNQYKVLLV